MTLDAIYIGEYDCEIPLVHDYAHRYTVAAELVRSNPELSPLLIAADLAAADDFALAHDHDYAAELYRTALGAATRYPRVPVMFERQGLGGTLAAVRHARTTGGTTYHLGGGYHHANFARPGSIDFVNDVAAALVDSSRALPGSRQLYLDVDAHAPDGAHAIISSGVCRDIELDCISLHMAPLAPSTSADSLTAGIPWNIGLPPGTTNAVYLAQLAQVVNVVADRGPYDFVFVQAGVDPHVDDPTANLALDLDGLYARDAAIAELVKTLSCPAAFVLGGGHNGAVSGRAAYNTIRALAGLPMPEGGR